MLTEKQAQLISDIENYNIIAKSLAKDVFVNRPDTVEFALQKQNELLSEFMDLEESKTDTEENK